MNIKNYKKTQLAASVAMIVSAMASASVLSQESAVPTNENNNIEEVVVTGIRGSLMRSMDIKRESSGVVDAISAEEMGKFPETNLAESLQRIPGVSISRSNGEGSEVTVRGFGPDFNLVLLNGRQMPGTGYDRSFKFENLSSDGVSSIELYKSARAEIPTGGLGATINIITTKPLASPGQKIAIMGKGNMDTSNEKGSDITPEFSGIYSNTFLDDTLGFAATFSHQRRDFQQQVASISGWQANVGLGSPDAADVIDNRPVDSDGNLIENYTLVDAEGDYYAGTAHFFPKEMGYNFSDIERRRTNGQATLQYQPVEALVVTLDYTASLAQTATERFGWGIWNEFDGNINGYELDENGTAIWADISGNDGSFTARKDTTEIDSKSIGLNIDWQATDSLNFTFDYHDSSTETDDGADSGTGYSGQVILGSNQLESKEYDYRTGDIPSFLVNWNNGTNELAANEIDANFSQFFHQPGKSEIQQLQIHGTWLPDFFEPLTEVKFGVAHSDQTLSGYNAWSGLQGSSLQGLEAVLPDSMFTRHEVGDFLDEFDGGGSALSPNYYYTFDYGEAIARLAAYQDNYTADPLDDEATFNEVNEKISGAYVQTEWQVDIGYMPAQINAGFRYETTDVTNPSENKVPEQVIWATPSEWITEYTNDGEILAVTYESQNDVFLPMIDIKMDVTDDLVARASWGKSITRPGLSDLMGGLDVTGSPKIGSRTGSSGNPNLKPYKSTNMDLSVEYYYDDTSYVSIGWFNKKVEDWIETGSIQSTIDGIYDVYQGARWNEAVANIEGRDEQATTTAIWDEMTALGYATEDGVFVADATTDELMVWTFSSRVNASDTREAHGYEFAAQHMFWDTGFGGSLNVTLVDGNVTYDPYILDTQKALEGLSDSANFQAFYEKNGLSVKLVYAWRDSYLLGQGQDQGSAEVPPQFFKAFGQWDVSVNYEVNDNLTVFFDGININNETEEGYGRFEEQFLFARQYGPRYSLGARYNFQ